MVAKSHTKCSRATRKKQSEARQIKKERCGLLWALKAK